MDVLRELALSPGAIEILHQFQGLIEKWTPRINLVAKSTVAEIWPRHIVDSARLCLVPVPSLRLWADLGAGLFPKGERFGEEVKNARQNWRFDLEARENLDHKGSALLVLRNLSRAV